MKEGFAQTGMSQKAQKRALQILDCVEKNDLRFRLWVPYFGRVHLVNIPGWMVLRIRQRFAVVDYSRASNTKRMWIFDTSDGTVVGEMEVRHGHGKGTQKKRYVGAFSNTPHSQLSSLGVLTGTLPALGGLKKKWPSKRILLLEGQENNWNSNVRERDIVIHSTRYSYSHGCLSMPMQNLDNAMWNLAFGGVVFAYYPNAKYNKHSKFMRCS